MYATPPLPSLSRYPRARAPPIAHPPTLESRTPPRAPTPAGSAHSGSSSMPRPRADAPSSFVPASPGARQQDPRCLQVARTLGVLPPACPLHATPPFTLLGVSVVGAPWLVRAPSPPSTHSYGRGAFWRLSPSSDETLMWHAPRVVSLDRSSYVDERGSSSNPDEATPLPAKKPRRASARPFAGPRSTAPRPR
jgi:hypothetical protein